MSTVSCRDTLGLFFGAGATLALTACSSSDQSPVASVGSESPSATTPPATTPSVALEDTVRDLTLKMWAAPAVATIVGDFATDVWSFGAEVVEGDPASVTPSNSYLGPTLHLRPGQRVRISFENRVSEPSIVHWHGLLVPQDQDGQPSDAVDPDGTYEYDFVVENDPGTYWYHSHPHGKTGGQVYRGLAGLLIVHGDEPSLPSGDNDLSLVLQDRTIGSDGQLRYASSMHDRMAGFVGETLVANGVADYAVEVRPEAYRVRLLNGSNSRTQYITLSTGDSLTAIAADGVLLPAPAEMNGLVLAPAQRTDLWIDFSAFEPGQRISLMAANTFVEAGGGMGGDDNEGEMNLEGISAATFVLGDSAPVPGTLPSSLGQEPDFAASDAVNASNPKQFTLATRMGSHQINGLQWEGRSTTDTETVAANTVELWEFVSESPLAHPMHMHGRAFRVVSRSWDDDSAADSWKLIEHGVIDQGLRDTVLVWPGQRVQIAVPFAAHKGYFPYHCHILEHEDSGMMRNFLVT